MWWHRNDSDFFSVTCSVVELLAHLVVQNCGFTIVLFLVQRHLFVLFTSCVTYRDYCVCCVKLMTVWLLFLEPKNVWNDCWLWSYCTSLPRGMLNWNLIIYILALIGAKRSKRRGNVNRRHNYWMATVPSYLYHYKGVVASHEPHNGLADRWM